MDYASVVKVYSELEATASRLDKTSILSEFLKRITEEEMELIVPLLRGRVFPGIDERKVGVAAKLVTRAIAIATGVATGTVEKEWKSAGDLGLVAEKLIASKHQATLFSADLSVSKVFSNIRKLASLEGAGSVDYKVKLISELLTSAKPLEARYIVRTVLEDLRVGVAAGTLRDSIVQAFLYDVGEKKADYNNVVDVVQKDAVQNAYNMCNDFAVVAAAARKGMDALRRIDLQVGRPVQVMLAQKEATITDAFKRVGKPAALEYKYDGFRMLVHKQADGELKIFTRRLENVTRQFPEVVESVLEYVQAKDFILDCEGVGFDSMTNKYLPFQSISQRIRRKYGIEDLSRRLPVELNVFDILYYNGESLLDKAFLDRRKLLESILKSCPRKIVLAKQIITDDETEALRFFEEAKYKGDEGIMFKSLGSPYKPGSRAGFMVKYKTTMDTLDLVVVGAEWGEGKRSGWLTSFTVACQSDDRFLEIGKVGTGIKEHSEQGLSFAELTEMLKVHIIEEKGRKVRIRPAVVLEIAFEEIQASTTYASGFALRFPRVIRDRTMEKGLDDASDIDLVRMHYSQQRK